MYIIVNKDQEGVTTKENFLWCNPAPLEQRLRPKEVWAEFDPSLHKVLEIEFKPGDEPIFVDGDTVKLPSIKEKIDAGIIELSDKQKLDGDNKIVALSIDELYEKNLVTKADYNKIKYDNNKFDIISSISSKELFTYKVLIQMIEKLISSGSLKISDFESETQTQITEIKTLLETLKTLK